MKKYIACLLIISSCIMKGMENNDVQIFESILHETDPEGRYTLVWNILQEAPTRGLRFIKKLCDFLQENNFDVNYQRKQGGSTLMHDIARCSMDGVIQEWIRIGGIVDTQNIHGFTPLGSVLIGNKQLCPSINGGLTYAVSYNLHNAKILIAHGAKTDVITTENYTFLHIAAVMIGVQERQEMIKYLLLCGVDSQLKDKSDLTAYDVAKNCNLTNVMEILKDKDSEKKAIEQYVFEKLEKSQVHQKRMLLLSFK